MGKKSSTKLWKNEEHVWLTVPQVYSADAYNLIFEKALKISMNISHKTKTLFQWLKQTFCQVNILNPNVKLLPQPRIYH